MKLYHSINIRNKQEHVFLEFILNKFPYIEYLMENYRLEKNQYDSSVIIAPIIESLRNGHKIALTFCGKLNLIMKELWCLNRRVKYHLILLLKPTVICFSLNSTKINTKN